METAGLLLKGFAVGIIASAPIGSVGILIIHRIISHTRRSALVVALGSMLADTIFCIIAVYGLNSINLLIKNHHYGLGTFGSFLMLYVGLNIFFSKPKEKVIYDANYTYAKDFSTGFILTITNPLTIIAILALFAWFGIDGNPHSFIPSTLATAGFIAGLTSWWLFLTEITSRFKNKIKIPAFKMVNQVFGLIIMVLAILLLLKL